MYCKHCGSRIDDDSTFCSKCGQPLRGGSKASYTSEKSYVAKRNSSGMSFAKVIYALIAVLCIIPLPIAEYRRIVLGKFDAQYWLMAAPILVTCFFLYRMIAGEKIREEKERINEAKRNGLDYEDKLLKIRTDAMTVCCVVVAIVAFASSGIINLFF